MARAAHAQLDLEKIVWMPTGEPRYRQAPVASAEHRVAMLRLALESEHEGEIDPRELAPGASGYTVDTLHELRLELGRETTLVLLLGTDQYEKLGSWHRPDEVKRVARIAVFKRPGFGKRIDRETLLVDMEPMAIAGSEIRARLARGEPIDELVPAPVASYIAEHGLYRLPS
ncbi:MAG: nicotinate-nucleotide adenylyltransferase [Betaproteobacteria bacterium]|jgi:nicotinate-nucleotide adenylyltransferase|nr:nicotinate-nucleotide adenylyltransferase [Betaproteobacteria bacterium]